MAKRKTEIEKRIEKIKKEKLAEPHQLEDGEISILERRLMDGLERNPGITDKELWKTAIDWTLKMINTNTTMRFKQVRKR